MPVALPDRYTDLRRIAAGGMATVYAAQDTRLGRKVAIKVLHPHVAASADARERFAREARAAARVGDHPHVVAIYDVGEAGGTPYLVMAHFDGGTVADRLRAGRVPRGVALGWLEEAASALDHAHRQGIVHRDVKPGNLLLDADGRLAVGDFGLARMAAESSLTQTGTVLGTAAYLSPEQALGRSATAASDRYALAVVAFELLTGRRPFPAEHPAAQTRAHVELPPPAASEVAPELPAAVDRVLWRGLEKDPARRWDTAGRFVEALDEALAGSGELATQTLPVTPVRRPAGEGAVAQPPATRRAARGPSPGAAGGPGEVAPRRTPSEAAGRPREPTRRAGRGRTSGAAAGGRGETEGARRRARGWIVGAGLGGVALLAGAAIALLAGGGGDGGSPATQAAVTRQSAASESASRSERRERETTTAAPTATTPPATEAAPTTEATPPAAPEGGSGDETGAGPGNGNGSGNGNGNGNGRGKAKGQREVAGDPSTLLAQGHQLLLANRPAEAIAPLRQAVDGCPIAQTDPCAYAYYDLGRALRLAGQPQAAVPVLLTRLQNPDQRETVLAELRAARREARQG